MNPSNSSEIKDNPMNSNNVKATLAASLLRTGALYPLDTSVKRLQNNPTSIKNLNSLGKIVFNDAHDKSMFQKGKSMYRGVGWAGAHKMSQLSILNLGLPYTRYQYESLLGGKSITADILSGCTMGIMEAGLLLLPDTYKLRMQTKSAVSTKNYVNPYKAFPITTLRNSVFFSASNGLYPYIKAGIEKTEVVGKSKNKQEVVSKATSATVAVVFSNGPDVVKTRVANLPKDSKETTLSVSRRIIQTEGLTAFSKGLAPRLCSSFIGFFVFFGVESSIKKALANDAQPVGSLPGNQRG